MLKSAKDSISTLSLLVYVIDTAGIRWVENLLLARRLIEAGVRLVGVAGFCGKSPNARHGAQGFVVNCWDMHGSDPSSPIFGTEWNSLGWCVPRFDQAVSALLEDLALRGLLTSTLVVAVGEFGRTPRMQGPAGRDHWPYCYTAMLAGAGIRGGAVYGASDRIAAYVRDRPVSPEDFGATIFHALGIPPDMPLGPTSFARPIVSTGRPILEIFG